MTKITHSLIRTNPKGQPFIGTCYQCGMEGLPAEAARWPCQNSANLTQDEALVIALADDTREPRP